MLQMLSHAGAITDQRQDRCLVPDPEEGSGDTLAFSFIRGGVGVRQNREGCLIMHSCRVAEVAWKCTSLAVSS